MEDEWVCVNRLLAWTMGSSVQGGCSAGRQLFGARVRLCSDLERDDLDR